MPCIACLEILACFAILLCLPTERGGPAFHNLVNCFFYHSNHHMTCSWYVSVQFLQVDGESYHHIGKVTYNNINR
jgi:hypothetical protein